MAKKITKKTPNAIKKKSTRLNTKKPAAPKPAAKPAAKSAAKSVYFPDRAALRAWLHDHHDSHPAIWLVYDKKQAKADRALTYDDIVEEALCFGWIDSVARSVDAARASLYFSPRKPGSTWSAVNKKRLPRLIEQGLIHPAGQAKIDRAKKDGSWTTLDAIERLEVPADLASAFDANPKAKTNFDAFPPGARKQILYWITSAKRDETRADRIRRSLAAIAKGQRQPWVSA
ncbi:MAG TPA: YdeI/OmpD-associated family protein [Phycisphaerales bacterium]